MGIMESLFGGPRPPLQPKGPAPFAQPDKRDREALFWWLKRNTSYTAIEHNAKLWAEFVAEWEKWLRGQDDPTEHLVTTLRYALDSQICYERGLKGLRQGDRSVFDRKSSEGWLGKVNTGLVDRRLEWSPSDPRDIARVDGFPESMVRLYFKAHDAAMAVGHTISYSALNHPRRRAARPLLAALPFDPTLPEPQWSVAIKPGGRAPRDGIYEQVDAGGHIVGGMAYFIKGQVSDSEDGLEFGPNRWDQTHQRSNDFLWRLLWEDTRYKDGTIPEEEQHYPTPEQSLAIESPDEDVNLRCEANQPCPRPGYWFTPAQAGSRQHFEQGQVMPSLGGDYGQTIWQWDEVQV
jgi:hypothetical protein